LYLQKLIKGMKGEKELFPAMIYAITSMIF